MSHPHFTPGVPGPSDTAPIPAVPAQPGPPPGPPPGPSRNRALLLRGAGLVAIAVVAGLVWYLIRHDSTPQQPVAESPATTAKPAFDYKLAEGPVKATDCAANAYSGAKKFFQDNQCTSLARALYTVQSGDAKALVSVVLVTMPDAAKATELKQLTDQDGTGNVSDLVRDGTFHDTDAPKLSGDQAVYESKASGPEVTIVLTDFYYGHHDKPLLEQIAKNALKLSGKLR
ncbi:hypothetical protein [Amycolatopsis echigonensis]|uniref:Uncharacterized protein n=1 Tax=Amycolatopsis echigonensis TaxID=2576905 RepID=A0A8E1W8S8_9PSEU|nr:hypothetical protein [Amycolatopsis echigonensis]MBB2505986.1 hypothetical protein [Amycolatopsis echigonensis]